MSTVPSTASTSWMTAEKRQTPLASRVNLAGLLPAFAVGVLSALLAALGSWSVSIWTDEAATISAATRSLPELFQLLGRIDAVHGLYYGIMHFWIAGFGSSPMALRLPSALACGAAGAGVYALARLLLTPRIALTSGLIFAILPRVTWMGIEARSFGPSAMFAVWMSVLLVISQRRGRWWWALYAATTAAGVGINVYVALLLAAHALALLAVRVGWRVRWTWLASAFTGLVLASPVIYLVALERTQIGNSALTVLYFMRSALINQWFLGDTPTPVSPRTGENALLGAGGVSLWAASATVLAALCWLLIARGVVLCGRRTHALPEPPRFTVVLLVAWIVVPVLAVGLYSFAVHPIYNPRYFTFGVTPVAILIAIGLATLRRRWLAWTTVALIVACAVPVYISQRQPYAKSSTDWVAAAAFVGRHKSPGDGVYFSPLTPPTGRAVERTTRYIATAYPKDFANLEDITLRTKGAQNGTLTGSSRLLADSLAGLHGIKTLWVIRPRGYPTNSAQSDDDVLRRAGFRAHRDWAGPLDRVIEFDRR